ncbi:poly-gamma-glutamate hydrolase family protein [Vreelandella rituensis]|uniref:Replication protein n=1 Tax=Vreelandella rituensis TaxID=2282306 RepID=A0A368TW43_9GAMM|nr:poly-gamma-glutamate hydrolase family protein [Halomonas rituensis]RCV89039.1 replication protein [Halomonas rituensis]
MNRRFQPMRQRLTAWLRQKGWIRQRGDRYGSFASLERHEPDGAFSIAYADRGSPITIMAIHGGKIEPGTSSLAKQIAGDTFNYYCFNGQKARHNWDLHITSTAFDEPVAMALARRSSVVLTLHGCMDRGAIAYTGGDHLELCQQLERQLNNDGIESRPHPVFHGRGRDNICNRGQQGGVQLELTPRLRICPFARRKRRTFVNSVRKILSDSDSLDGL